MLATTAGHVVAIVRHKLLALRAVDGVNALLGTGTASRLLLANFLRDLFI